MPAIRNTKTLAECLSLKKESGTEKSLLERIEMELHSLNSMIDSSKQTLAGTK